MTIEKFVGLFHDLPTEFLARLDRNLFRLARETSATSVASAYTFSDSDTIDSLQVNATSAALTISLPASPTGPRRRRVIKTDASGNAVTVSGNGSLINGASTVVLAAQYDRITVEPTGTGWLRVD